MVKKPSILLRPWLVFIFRIQEFERRFAFKFHRENEGSDKGGGFIAGLGFYGRIRSLIPCLALPHCMHVLVGLNFKPAPDQIANSRARVNVFEGDRIWWKRHLVKAKNGWTCRQHDFMFQYQAGLIANADILSGPSDLKSKPLPPGSPGPQFTGRFVTAFTLAGA